MVSSCNNQVIIGTFMNFTRVCSLLTGFFVKELHKQIQFYIQSSVSFTQQRVTGQFGGDMEDDKQGADRWMYWCCDKVLVPHKQNKGY